MELQIINNPTPFQLDEVVTEHEEISTGKAFIEANTIPLQLQELKHEHIIPVFLKDNEPLISHSDFIETVMQVVEDNFHYDTILNPNIRVSHPIKGRVPIAKNKPANELLDHEKTLYYERMAFVVEIPSIQQEIDGSNLSLMVGGVKSFSMDNLYNKKGADQHFKLFIGFQNRVCLNLCVWTDGFKSDVKITSLGELQMMIKVLIKYYNPNHHLYHLKQLNNLSISEQQFALMIGRLRMYNHLPRKMQSTIPALNLGDTQIASVVKDYYKDESFCRGEDGEINLWRLYNLFTNANKSSYIDNFVDRSVNAYQFVEKIRYALEDHADNWYLY
jgi:hypothetical protein